MLQPLMVRGLRKGFILYDWAGKPQLQLNKDITAFAPVSMDDWDEIGTVRLSAGDKIPKWFSAGLRGKWEMIPYKGDNKDD